MSPTFQELGSAKESDRYQIRPQSYKSDMSSTAAFDAIKHHLATMPGKPENVQNDRTEFDQYIEDANPVLIETASELRETTRDTSPRPMAVTNEARMERSSLNENKIHLGPKPPSKEQVHVVNDDGDDDEDEYDDDADIQSSEKVEEEQVEEENEEEEEEYELDDLLGEDDNDKVENKKEEIGNSEEMISMYDKFEASEQSKKSVQEQTENKEEVDIIKKDGEDEEEQEIDL